MNVNPVNVNEVQNAQLEVMMLRLLNGDEIVGKVGVVGNMIKVVKPAAVMVQPGAAGKAQMALVDFIPMAKTKEIILDPRNVMFTYEPDSQIESAYNQNFGSGLVLPKKGILTTAS
jgi:preprotein translocase subunit YajC